MRIYLHDNKTQGRLERLCKRAGLEVLTHEEVMTRDTMPEGVNFFLDQVDALILEVTNPTQEIYFVLAQAMLTNKPTLCLYAKNQTPQELISYVKRRPAPRPIKTFSYTGATLIRSLTDFLIRQDPDQLEYDDIPSIKYTVRLTPKVDRYLKWISQQKKMNKADFLRDLLTTMAVEDPDFKDLKAPNSDTSAGK
ncbi:MAG: hypothetical protein COW24_04370 [Candidatus Kerfeldbacteria bacterium CG15_BIG_FIL_POST_REV_8_21_14_020_45_12]|uniref:Uncharacterized protein n=1 Tax=Candidatus Kerfeldbacteria bacterium CG15_BIG_FIL_POST_REV_8_21_14_020_45_12 TaxID=2014247 RepID=A0A2M7H302_9BACT|nr:MAG: hypothetical protein COW24_04370 [Candidatus Kerfeldbacteria bacterium CG15_BIG_FIL_POST_REV_8_21_14_020_45_12]PJA93390.1 MAG: hypothetical protein CO132_03475 [Candidatus Kerfeldbacteria bacterium CG_4_9_14_3_um_filter_45_8]